MAVTVRKAAIWRKEVDNLPGALAETLKPLAEAGANLKIVMGYRYPGMESRAAIDVHPVSGRKSTNAAKQVGLAASSISCLVVEGDNRLGLGYAIAQALSDSGINMASAIAMAVGRRYSALFSFDSETDADKAASLIKKAAASRRR